MRGVAAASPRPADPWEPARGAGDPLKPSEERRPPTRTDSVAAAHLASLSLVDVVDVALRNNPQTHLSWRQARVAADALGSARGRWLPTVSVDGTASPSKVISANPARLPAERTTETLTGSLSYLLLDFGGRSGNIGAAREALFAADFSHNATLQNVALQAELSAFQYQSARGLLLAAQAAVRTAEANLTAAERRHDVGLATIGDVLQARTALSQAQLVEQGASGTVQVNRATLAAAIGVPPTDAFELALDTLPPAVQVVATSVDSLIAQAERDRPDLAATRAQVRQANQVARATLSSSWPSLTVAANRGRAWSSTPTLVGSTYALTLGISIPVFNGFSRQYDAAAARDAVGAATARAEQARLLAGAQVYASYFALRTAAQRVSTATELLASATRSEEVARGRYAEGVGSILDVLSAQSALADARAQSVQARWSWSAALAQLAHDAGVLGPRGEPALPLIPASSSGGPK
ncbi:MAG: TolC family protein [Gemmatimonadaceae bacterium]